METVTSADGTRIAFDRLGTGPPLILVGGTNCSRTVTRGTADALSRRLTVLNYDRRGRGDSGDTAPYSVDREVDDLRVLTEAAGGRAALYGHSSGAALAVLAVAQDLPVAALVLHDAPYSPEGPGGAQRQQAAREYDREVRALLADGRTGDAAALFMELVGTPRDQVARFRDEPWWRGLEALAPTLAHDSAVMGNAGRGGTAPTELLRRVQVPALVLTGGESGHGMREVGETLAATLPNGRHESLPGQGHVVPPGVVAPVIERFLLSL